MNNVLLYILLALTIYIILMRPIMEMLDASNKEYIPLMATNGYGLRGEELHRYPISDHYYPADRNIRISKSGAWMYQALPGELPAMGCTKSICPVNDEYDAMDTCWTCPHDGLQQKIPNIHEH